MGHGWARAHPLFVTGGHEGAHQWAKHNLHSDEILRITSRGTDEIVKMCLLFYPRDAVLARVFATATCLSVCPDVSPSHAGIVPSIAKAGS